MYCNTITTTTATNTIQTILDRLPLTTTQWRRTKIPTYFLFISKKNVDLTKLLEFFI